MPIEPHELENRIALTAERFKTVEDFRALLDYARKQLEENNSMAALDSYAHIVAVIKRQPELTEGANLPTMEEYKELFDKVASFVSTCDKLMVTAGAMMMLKIVSGGNLHLLCYAFKKEASVHVQVGSYFGAVSILYLATKVQYTFSLDCMTANKIWFPLQCDPFDVILARRKEKYATQFVDRSLFGLLNDHTRNDTYKRAIEHLVRLLKEAKQRELTIVDTDACPGLLAMYAIDADPSNCVIACDASAVAMSLTSEIAISKNLKNILLVPRNSKHLIEREIVQPQTVDLALVGRFDPALLTEEFLETLLHLHEQLLDKDVDDNRFLSESKLIPCKAVVYMAPVESWALARLFKVSGQKPGAVATRLGHLRISGMHLVSNEVMDAPYLCEKMARIHEGFEFLAPSQVVKTIDFENYFEIADLRQTTETITLTFKTDKVGRLDAFALWFKLILVDNADFPSTLSSAVYSSDDSSWEQAIYPINKAMSTVQLVYNGEEIEAEVELKDYFRLAHVSRVSPHRQINGEQDFINVVIPEEIVTEMNDTLLMDHYAVVADEICKRSNKTITLLDYTTSSVLALNVLQQRFKNKLVILFKITSDEDESYVQSRVRLLTEIVKLNAIPQGHIEVSEQVAVGRDKFDLVLVDPVASDGTLNVAVWRKMPFFVDSLQGQNMGILPRQVSVRCQLIECQEIYDQYIVKLGNGTCHGYNVESTINRAASHHMKGVTLSTSVHRELSRPIDVHDINLCLDEPSDLYYQTDVHVLVQQPGHVHGLMYWFEIGYGYGLPTFETYDPEEPTKVYHYKQAMISLEHPLWVNQFDILKFRFIFNRGLLDFIFLSAESQPQRQV